MWDVNVGKMRKKAGMECDEMVVDIESFVLIKMVVS